MVVTKVVEMPEKKPPDKAVAETDKEDRQDPSTIAYVQKHAHNSQCVVCTVFLGRRVFPATSTSVSGFIVYFRVVFFHL